MEVSLSNRAMDWLKNVSVANSGEYSRANSVIQSGIPGYLARASGQQFVLFLGDKLHSLLFILCQICLHNRYIAKNMDIHEIRGAV